MRIHPALLAVLLAVGGCGPFVPDTVGPGGDPNPTGPTVALPFRLGSFLADEGRAVVWTGGGVVLTSWFNGTVNFDPQALGSGSGVTSFGDRDVAVSKYDSTGAFQWVFSFGGTGSDVPLAAAATPDGGVVVAGYGTGGGTCAGRVFNSAGGRDVVILKIDASGNCQWGQLLGGSGDDEARGVAVATDGSIFVVGSFTGTADFNDAGAFLLQSYGSEDGFLLELANDGGLIDAVHGGGPGVDRYNAVAVAPDGEVSVAGEFNGTASYGSSLAPVVLQSVGLGDAMLARYTALLGLRWATRFGGPGADRATAVTHDNTGDPLVAGSFEATADLDPSGSTALVVSHGGADLFLSRYSATSGDWDGRSFAVGGAGSESVTSLVRHISGRVILGGFFQETVDFDPGPGARLLVAKGTGGAGDAFVLGVSSEGNYAWVDPVGGVVGGGGNLSIGYGLALDDFGRVWATGRFFGRADFDPGTEAVELTSRGSSDIFLSRYDVQSGELVARPLP